MAKELREGTVPLYVYIPVEMKQALEEIVSVKGTTASALLRNILEVYIETFIEKNQKKKVKKVRRAAS
jgi:hypothetical protein